MAAVAWEDGLVLLAIVVHLVIAPYTKVEESFGVQAAHDLLVHGADLASYDHQQFPGAVPRTFIGAILTAAAVAPAKAAAAAVAPALRPALLLYAVRLAMALFSAAAHARLRRAVARTWGVLEGRCLDAISVLQFHLPFYMSRTLPNTFALILAYAAHAELLGGSGYGSLAILGFAAAVFRCDLLVLIAPIGLLLLAQGRVAFFKAALATASAAPLGGVLSVAVDSLMWGRWLWPEFEVLWFNTAENKSGDWGHSPPLWYFYSALPRALLGALPLAAIGVIFERRARGLLVCGVVYVALYSLLPHKELRFLFPALPLFNAAAAAGAARFLRMQAKGALRGSLALLALLGLAVATLAATGVMAAASAANYPGGLAMAVLQASEPPQPALSVHIGNLAATTGVSRFLEEHPDWTYSKEEGLEPGDLRAKGFDRLLSEWPEVPGFACRAVVLGFERIAFSPRTLPPLSLRTKPQIYVLARSDDGSTLPCDDASPSWG